MRINIFIRDIDSEYPIKLIKEKSKSAWLDSYRAWLSDWTNDWQNDWTNPWSNPWCTNSKSFRTDDSISPFLGKINTIAKELSSISSDDFLLNWIANIIVREENFGGLLYDKLSKIVFSCDNEAYETIKKIQKTNIISQDAKIALIDSLRNIYCA